uniref:Uncharacterized protein n=1 Tax=Timema bartmani TaxID=61472 RepID=A0A7R9FAD3_9NEOP|nr:unnamed protein product [Timema bartmani]
MSLSPSQASVVYNPIVYGLSHPHFRSSVAQYLSACKTGNSLQNTSMMPVVAAGSMTRKQSNHKHDLHPRAPSSGNAGAAVIYKNPVNHHHIHQTHFRCFPHQNREDSDYFYSEPEPPTRPVSCLVKYGEAGRNICCVSRVRHLKTSSSHAEARPIQDLLKGNMYAAIATSPSDGLFASHHNEHCGTTTVRIVVRGLYTFA